ncbi:MAG: hypothetical protein INR69_12180 [Mucilaginibacter polytrichastri]|nr:hypothetical protein [Mucilaginibacter polytrichastri]
MDTLSANWFAEGTLDLEYKQYVLLAWLQGVNKHFHRNELYPQLSDLVFHYNNLLAFRKNKQSLYDRFPGRLTEASIEQVRLSYEKMVKDDSLMQQIEEIVHYALPRIDTTLKNGRSLYDEIEASLTILPVGLVPLQTDHGYFFLQRGKSRSLRVYQYSTTLFENTDARYRGISATYIHKYERSLANTPESIKADLIRNRKELPNPAVYHVECRLHIPIEETLLPVTKKCLVKYMA